MENFSTNPNQTFYENTSFQSNRTKKQTLILDVVNSVHREALINFELTLPEPLIIDKLSDIYLDSFTTYGALQKPTNNINDVVKNMGFLLKINQFNILSKIATNIKQTIAPAAPNPGCTNYAFDANGSIFIPNDTPPAAANTLSTTHKGKKMNYICSINPTTISQISGKITDIGHKLDGAAPLQSLFTGPLSDEARIGYGSPFHVPNERFPNRFIAEFVIISRE